MGALMGKNMGGRIVREPRFMHFRGPIALTGFLILLIYISPSNAAPVGDRDAQSVALAAALQGLKIEPASRVVEPGEATLVRSIYGRMNSTLLWITHGELSQQASALVTILRTADELGLEPSAYGADLLTATATQLGSQSSEEDYARFDILLTQAAVRLISHLHYGRVDPPAAGFELTESRHDLDIASAVAALTSSANVADVVADAEPHFLHYSLLKTALGYYRGLSGNPALTQLPTPGKRTLHLGDAYEGARVLRKLLMAEGDIPGRGNEAADLGLTLDAVLVAALKHFQDRHGLRADGTLGATTFSALSTPTAQRVRQIELTLERWRWLPAFQTPPIIVNIPEFKLFAFDTTADRVASMLQMPVIVGQTNPSKRTPIFLGDLKYLIFRPYWNVPRSITTHEMLPAIRAHSDYLQRNNLEIVRGESDDSEVLNTTPSTIAALASGQLRLRQRPGNDNALGLIKFLFPNAHNVYLHATPGHSLFLASRRAFSHGCIRVSDPEALAAYVLRNAATRWDGARIEAAMHDSKSLRVDLREPIHVMILYGTAMATEDGRVQFFDDIYGHDRKLEQLLSLRAIHSAAVSR